MRRTWKIVLVLFVLASCYAAIWKFGLPFIPAAEYEVKTNEYASQDVLLRAYRGEEGPESRWLLLGTSSGKARIMVSAGRARGIYKTPGFSDVNHYRPYDVTVYRRYLGFVWVPREKVRFTANLQELPVYPRQGTLLIRDQFTADLKTLAAGQTSR